MPTQIKVKAGDTLSVTLANNLPAAGFDTSSLHNEYRSLDVTNIHTHGLHISGEAPGDSIFTEVAAGDQRRRTACRRGSLGVATAIS